MDNSFRYIFIYRFSYSLTYYYSFLAYYNKKCFDINWFHLLSPAILSLWYPRFEITWLLRDDPNSKTRVRYVYVLPANFLSEIKYLFNLEGNILHILTRNVIFFYDWLFQLRWTLIQHFQIFHVNKPKESIIMLIMLHVLSNINHRHSNSGPPFFLIWSLPRLWYGS